MLPSFSSETTQVCNGYAFVSFLSAAVATMAAASPDMIVSAVMYFFICFWFPPPGGGKSSLFFYQRHVAFWTRSRGVLQPRRDGACTCTSWLAFVVRPPFCIP